VNLQYERATGACDAGRKKEDESRQPEYESFVEKYPHRHVHHDHLIKLYTCMGVNFEKG
jgi:hypothetical protein